IARMWFDSGTIVSTVNRIGKAEYQKAINRSLTNKPLVVLVDGAPDRRSRPGTSSSARKDAHGNRFTPMF
ncbi:hypothetical protein, partial [Moorena sp. SIO2C4]|uniref:hypothetical protein n=1 Tax=Moorena sp. SIO2C4 TaxID=2607824 RepID=UPI00338DADBB